MSILALDPATLTGWAMSEAKEYSVEKFAESGPRKGDGLRTKAGGFATVDADTVYYGTCDVSPRPKRKGCEGEPKEARLCHFFDFVDAAIVWFAPQLVVMEEAAAFMRGKAAVEIAHQLRGIVELRCYQQEIKVVTMTPQDLKRAALGKGSGEKEEMIAAAAQKYGYKGADDNEADALHLLAWAMSGPRFAVEKEGA